LNPLSIVGVGYGFRALTQAKKIVQEEWGLDAKTIDQANALIKVQQRKKIPDSDEIAKAEALYRKVLQGKKYCPDLHFSLYRACCLKGEYEKAKAEINSALLDCGNYLPAIDALGLVRNETGLSLAEEAELAQLQSLQAQYGKGSLPQENEKGSVSIQAQAQESRVERHLLHAQPGEEPKEFLQLGVPTTPK